jgi:GTP cyclohydrolase I
MLRETVEKEWIVEDLMILIEHMHWNKDVNFEETPKRVAQWLFDYQGLSKKDCREKSQGDLEKRFPTVNTNMVVVGPTKVFSLCPHHMLPIEYDVWVGYIPNEEAVGLSKLSRVPQNFARYPFIQEDFTAEIADVIEKSLDPKGVMVWCSGVHNCMRMRGVKQPEARTITSALRGYFKNPPEGKNPREEFLEAVKTFK